MARKVIHSATITLKLPLDTSVEEEEAALQAAGIPVDAIGNAASGLSVHSVHERLEESGQDLSLVCHRRRARRHLANAPMFAGEPFHAWNAPNLRRPSKDSP